MKEKYCATIKDGEVTILKAVPDLEFLQKHAGGYVELIKGVDGVEVYVDEDARMKHLAASAVVARQLRGGVVDHLIIRGPLVLVFPRVKDRKAAMLKLVAVVVGLVVKSGEVVKDDEGEADTTVH